MNFVLHQSMKMKSQPLTPSLSPSDSIGWGYVFSVMVGTARCAVRAAFSGAIFALPSPRSVPPATARAGTSQRDVS